MDQHVADGAALLAVAPAVDVAADPVVETEAALLPQLQDGDGRERLPRGVPEHDVVGAEPAPGSALAHGVVEQHVAAQ